MLALSECCRPEVVRPIVARVKVVVIDLRRLPPVQHLEDDAVGSEEPPWRFDNDVSTRMDTAGRFACQLRVPG